MYVKLFVPLTDGTWRGVELRHESNQSSPMTSVGDLSACSHGSPPLVAELEGRGCIQAGPGLAHYWWQTSLWRGLLQPNCQHRQPWLTEVCMHEVVYTINSRAHAVVCFTISRNNCSATRKRAGLR